MLPLFIFMFHLLEKSMAANILAIFPFTAHSHFTMFEVLLEELHSKGHNLTVVSHFPLKESKENYTDINLAGATKSLNSNMSLSTLKNFGLVDNLNLLNEQIDDYEPIFKVPAIRTLIQSNFSFDLIITEIFNTDMFLGFAHKFKCPNVAMSASPLMPWAYGRVGLSIQPFVMPLVFSNRAYPMSFINMAANTIDWIFALFYYKFIMNRRSEEIARKYFGEIPPLEKLSHHTSFILVNTHFSIHPFMNSKRLIEVGGMHIKEPKPLENGLQSFMNSSEDGVIVFSMGSMFRTESIPKEIFSIFIKVFTKLKQNILWKWESGEHPNVKNIKFMKWLPQRDILAHPNVKLFIYHGGLLGISEAIYCGVPILGLPQFGDMPHNIAAIREAGLSLSLEKLTEESLLASINILIKNKRYKTKAKELSILFRDRPEHPLSKAVYWVEYAIRHNGSSHILQPPSEIHDLIIASAILLALISLPITFLLLVFVYLKPTERRVRKMKDI